MSPRYTVHPDFPPYLYEAYRATALRAPAQPLVELPRTLSEGTGPGSVVSAATDEDADLTTNGGTGAPAAGERIIVTGRVIDDEGNPVSHTLLEIWQARPTTVLFVTHDTREAARLADRVIVLTASPGSVQSIVAIDTPRRDRAGPDVVDRIRQQIMQPALNP